MNVSFVFETLNELIAVSSVELIEIAGHCNQWKFCPVRYHDVLVLASFGSFWSRYHYLICNLKPDSLILCCMGQWCLY